MIKFFCPHCSQKLGVPDEYANRRIRCSKCQQPSLVPQPLTTAQPVELDVLEEVPPPRPAASRPVEPVHRPPAPPDTDPSSGYADDLQIEVVPSNPNLEALAAARSVRTKQQRSALRKSDVKAPRSSGGSGVAGLAIGAGKVPLSIALALAFGLGVCILWTIVARLTGFIFVYFAVGVAAAAAYGLVVMTERRNAGLGIAAIFIALFCILIGKFMIARWVVMADFETEMSTAMEEVMAEDNAAGFADMSADEQDVLLANPMIIFNMGVMALWEEGQFDEAVSQELIMASVFDDGIDEQPEAPAGFENEHQAVLTHISEWTDARKMDALRTHYDSYLRSFQGWFVNSDVARGIGFLFAFIAAFSLLDLIILPIAGITAFKIASGGS